MDAKTHTQYSHRARTEPFSLHRPYPLKMHSTAATVSKNEHRGQRLIVTLKTAYREWDGLGNSSSNVIIRLNENTVKYPDQPVPLKAGLVLVSTPQLSQKELTDGGISLDATIVRSASVP